MSSRRRMTKSPVALAREALAVGQAGLPRYGSKRSRHDFTLPQLFAIMVLRKFFRTDYRGVVRLLEDLPVLGQELGLDKIPHYTTVHKAEQRLKKRGFSSPLLTRFLSDPPVAG